MQTHLGTHGTCRTSADAIRRSGFTPSAKGWSGPGVYLWAYVNDDTTAVYLAEQWWAKCHSQGDYDRLANRSKAVLHAEYDCAKEKYLDLTTTEALEQVNAIMVRYRRQEKILESVKSSPRQIAEVYAMLLNVLDGAGSDKPDLIKVHVTPPVPLDRIQPMPHAYIVRTRYSDIRIARAP